MCQNHSVFFPECAIDIFQLSESKFSVFYGVFPFSNMDGRTQSCVLCNKNYFKKCDNNTSWGAGPKPDVIRLTSCFSRTPWMFWYPTWATKVSIIRVDLGGALLPGNALGHVHKIFRLSWQQQYWGFFERI